MRSFQFTTIDSASKAAQTMAGGEARDAATQFLAGGTTLIDLMKLEVMQPETIADITPLARDYSEITTSNNGLRIGALAKMNDVAADPQVARDYPALAQSLTLAASAQLRNMATMGGNLLQRTRCQYFRDLAIALVALDAQLEILGASGTRTIPVQTLFRLPGDTPQIETTLAAGELITAITVPKTAMARRSLYVKIRDRQSYQFALASAAVALDLEGGTVKSARIALGGIATIPWRSEAAEQAITGKKFDDSIADKAAQAALTGAWTGGQNAFKQVLAQRTLARALLAAAKLEL